jgi:LmbE family N-acetylglucosaminyl deacetylase
MKKQYKAVFISPHLDDAVFSCGGTIAKHIYEGDVLILNIFTNFQDNIKKGAIVLGKNRYQEEADAASFLGFKSDNLGETDAFFRRKIYQSPAKLFDYIDNEDINYIAHLSEKIESYLLNIEYNFLYVPLGIGWHVDHILSYLAMKNHFTKSNLIFYEDAPYCLIPNAIRYRIQDLGTISLVTREDMLNKKLFFYEWYTTISHYIKMAPMKNLSPTGYRLIANIVVAIYLFKLMAKHRFFKQAAKNIRLKPFLNNITDYFQLKMHCISIYESQFKEFFLDAGDCESLYKDYSGNIADKNGFYERFWQIC